MSKIKLTISIPKALLIETDEFARARNLPRSKVVALALEDFLRRHTHQKLINQINAANEDTEDDEDKTFEAKMKFRFRQILKQDE